MKKLALLATIVGLSLSFNTSAKEDQSSVIERIKPFGSVCVQGNPVPLKLPLLLPPLLKVLPLVQANKFTQPFVLDVTELA